VSVRGRVPAQQTADALCSRFYLLADLCSNCLRLGLSRQGINHFKTILNIKNTKVIEGKQALDVLFACFLFLSLSEFCVSLASSSSSTVNSND